MKPMWMATWFTEIVICQLHSISLRGNRFKSDILVFPIFIFKEYVACLGCRSNFSIDKHEFWQFLNEVWFTYLFSFLSVSCLEMMKCLKLAAGVALAVYFILLVIILQITEENYTRWVASESKFVYLSTGCYDYLFQIACLFSGLLKNQETDQDGMQYLLKLQEDKIIFILEDIHFRNVILWILKSFFP